VPDIILLILKKKKTKVLLCFLLFIKRRTNRQSQETFQHQNEAYKIIDLYINADGDLFTHNVMHAFWVTIS
jgi:hypothetical protein